jgi:hypothetical protein
MRNEFVGMHVPEKPHGYIAAAVKLPKSGLRVLVDLEVQENSHKITAQSAMLAIIQRLRARMTGPFISIFGSAFVTKESISRLRSVGQHFVGSLKPTHAADFSAILKLGSVDIPTDEFAHSVSMIL